MYNAVIVEYNEYNIHKIPKLYLIVKFQQVEANDSLPPPPPQSPMIPKEDLPLPADNNNYLISLIRGHAQAQQAAEYRCDVQHVIKQGNFLVVLELNLAFSIFRQAAF